MEDKVKDFIGKTINMALENSAAGKGGPFAAIVVKNDEIVGIGINSVTTTNDPTAHAEVNAIRKASKKLGTFDLAGCEIYTSCEPCPMCLGAVYWAHLDKMYYGNTKIDAKNIGFDDSFIYDEIELKPEDRKVKTIQLLPEEAIKAFQNWTNATDKIEY